MKTLEEIIANSILTAREKLRWSQEKLAEMAGVSYHTVFRIEHGHSVRKEKLDAVARALGLSREELVTESAGPPTPTIAELAKIIERLEHENKSLKAQLKNRASKQETQTVQTPQLDEVKRPEFERLKKNDPEMAEILKALESTDLGKQALQMGTQEVLNNRLQKNKKKRED